MKRKPPRFLAPQYVFRFVADSFPLAVLELPPSPVCELRLLWSSKGVSYERQDALIAAASHKRLDWNGQEIPLSSATPKP